MATPTDPIQIDELPEEYDRAAAQRVLESALRRLSEQQGPAPSTPASTQPSPVVDDPLPWVL